MIVSNHLPALLRAALRHVLMGTISLPRPTRWQGSRSIVFQTEQSNGRRLIIKLTRGHNSYPVEAWVYRELRNAGLPVPEVLAYRARLPQLDTPCLILSMLDGTPLFTQSFTTELEQRIYRETGTLLARIHATTLPHLRFGLGAFLSKSTEALNASWYRFLSTYHAHRRAGQLLLDKGLLPGWTNADIDAIDARIALDTFPVVLNHGDFGPDHIFVHHQEVVGIIDPGQAFAGPAEYDLAYLACYLSDQQLRYVLGGYQTPIDHCRLLLYKTVIALHKAARAWLDGRLQRASDFATLAQAAWSLGHRPPDASTRYIT